MTIPNSTQHSSINIVSSQLQSTTKTPHSCCMRHLHLIELRESAEISGIHRSVENSWCRSFLFLRFKRTTTNKEAAGPLCERRRGNGDGLECERFIWLYFNLKQPYSIESLSGYDFKKELCDRGDCAIPNECLYRASFTNGYEYVTAVDLNQFLLPTNTSQNLKDFISTLNHNKTQIIQFPLINNSTVVHNDASKSPITLSSIKDH